MKAIKTVTKKFEKKDFIFTYEAEVGETWALTKAFEVSIGGNFIKSSWKKFISYKSKNTLLSSIEVNQ